MKGSNSPGGAIENLIEQGSMCESCSPGTSVMNIQKSTSESISQYTGMVDAHTLSIEPK